MTITKDTIADRIAAYLHHRIGLDDLVGWAENAVMDGEFDPADAANLTEVVARIGVADVRAFGLSWEDCEALLGRLGYSARVEVVAG
ncbi:MAG: hypothetical protein KF833_02835 [Verrucomicrobiae bacterium]|nr:hypothetical protein [Verrucomicrobiae bacterium]